MVIKRDAYLEQLKIRKDNGMIKIITGIRRCGKSFLLFVLFKKYLLESGVDNPNPYPSFFPLLSPPPPPPLIFNAIQSNLNDMVIIYTTLQ